MESAPRLKPCTSAGKTNSHARQINRQIWRKQRVFAVWKRGWIALILFPSSGTDHASEPRYFHLKVQHPNLQRILKALHELENRKVLAQ
jgi:hypothetical protein